ncbi:hypothetical protein [Ruminococcus albus]|uniref:Uncharacterized protein n=1 Tax=Ruminococcus albus TaxID=1264 RepID=A0A1I1D0M8_RUMAL|nr:hypothetical protein [Ruminococcus albus]SFB66360.1 hypothetical protein SAMN02910406_00051 [Ruminococcus albus]
MKRNIKSDTFKKFISFAFYPKITIIVCLIITALSNLVLGLIMHTIKEHSTVYNILYAILTGTTASFIVAIFVELTNNYRHNKLAWQELQAYYSVVTDYELHKQVAMGNTPAQRATLLAEIGAGLLNKDETKDYIEATWEQLPTIIPVLKDTLNNKKPYLTDKEIVELNNIVNLCYKQIWDRVYSLLIMSPINHNVMNHPDEDILNYPKNILDDMPDWLRKQLAGNANQQAMNKLVDEILSDSFLMSQFMVGYDISKKGISNYTESDTFDSDSITDMDNDYEHQEFETEEQFKKVNERLYQRIIESERPFVSYHLSNMCKDISDSIDVLENEVLKKPYYGFMLKDFKEAKEQILYSPMNRMIYRSELKRAKEAVKLKKEK